MGYTAQVEVHVYAADQHTWLDIDRDEDEGGLDAVSMYPGDLIYIVVDPYGAGGFYEIRMAQVQ